MHHGRSGHIHTMLREGMWMDSWRSGAWHIKGADMGSADMLFTSGGGAGGGVTSSGGVRERSAEIVNKTTSTQTSN